MIYFLLTTLAMALTPQEGDVVFQRSTSRQASAIALATGSNWTHTGLVRIIDGEPWVLEAVQPVKLTPYTAWVNRGVDHQILVRRPKEAVWTPSAIHKLDTLQATWLGRPYDLRFEPGTDALYCSELVREAYQQAAGIELTPLRTVDSYNVSNPKLREAMVARWGKVPSKMRVVAPSDLAETSNLVDVP